MLFTFFVFFIGTAVGCTLCALIVASKRQERAEEFATKSNLDCNLEVEGAAVRMMLQGQDEDSNGSSCRGFIAIRRQGSEFALPFFLARKSRRGSASQAFELVGDGSRGVEQWSQEWPQDVRCFFAEALEVSGKLAALVSCSMSTPERRLVEDRLGL